MANFKLVNKVTASTNNFFFKMEFFKKFPAFLIIAILLFSCSQKPASIANKSKNVYTKNSNLNKEKYRKAILASPPEEKPVRREDKLAAREEKFVVHEEKLKSHEIEVENGDTLYSISKKYQVTLRDLIKVNNLTAPYNLKAKTKLTIPTPNYHEVKQGETLYAISRAYNMKIDNLIEMNDLEAPYSVKVGEKIRISKIDEKPQMTVAENKAEVRINAEKIKPAEKPLESPKGVVEKTLDKFNHFSWPAKGQVVSKFGPKSGGLYNDGINIKAKEGSDVRASEDGVVAYVGNELKGYGNLVIVKHSGGWITAYAHLREASAKRGQAVVKGEKIGTIGATGNVTSAQLYFGLRKGRDAVNPENYLKS